MPTETIVEVRKGRKSRSERKFFPGYVLVKVDLTDALIIWLKTHQKLLVFGIANQAYAGFRAEVARIVGQIQEGVDSPRPTIIFDIGETSRLLMGRSRALTALLRVLMKKMRA